MHNFVLIHFTIILKRKKKKKNKINAEVDAMPLDQLTASLIP